MARGTKEKMAGSSVCASVNSGTRVSYVQRTSEDFNATSRRSKLAVKCRNGKRYCGKHSRLRKLDSKIHGSSRKFRMVSTSYCRYD